MYGSQVIPISSPQPLPIPIDRSLMNGAYGMRAINDNLVAQNRPSSPVRVRLIDRAIPIQQRVPLAIPSQIPPPPPSATAIVGSSASIVHQTIAPSDGVTIGIANDRGHHHDRAIIHNQRERDRYEREQRDRNIVASSLPLTSTPLPPPPPSSITTTISLSKPTNVDAKVTGGHERASRWGAPRNRQHHPFQPQQSSGGSSSVPSSFAASSSRGVPPIHVITPLSEIPISSSALLSSSSSSSSSVVSLSNIPADMKPPVLNSLPFQTHATHPTAVTRLPIPQTLPSSSLSQSIGSTNVEGAIATPDRVPNQVSRFSSLTAPPVLPMGSPSSSSSSSSSGGSMIRQPSPTQHQQSSINKSSTITTPSSSSTTTTSSSASSIPLSVPSSTNVVQEIASIPPRFMAICNHPIVISLADMEESMANDVSLANQVSTTDLHLFIDHVSLIDLLYDWWSIVNRYQVQ
jgi:hypothetical protein